MTKQPDPAGDTENASLVCDHCGTRFTPATTTGRPARYCKRSCRQRAYEARKLAALEAAAATTGTRPPNRTRRAADTVGVLAEIEHQVLILSQARGGQRDPIEGLHALAHIEQRLDWHRMHMAIEAEHHHPTSEIAAILGHTPQAYQAWLTAALDRHDNETSQ